MPQRLLASFTSLALCLFCASAHGQRLLEDIASVPTAADSGSNPLAFVEMGGIAYFTAEDAFGRELWRTDGTANGTWRIKDIAPGSASSNPSEFTVLDGVLYFTAIVEGLGRELWRSDGTAEGTFLVLDTHAQTWSTASVSGLTAYRGRLFFNANDGAHGNELWVSDGTPAGTQLLADLAVGGFGSDPRHFTLAFDLLYFTARDFLRGNDLWVTDGTPAGTRRVSDPSNPTTPRDFYFLTRAGDLLYVVAHRNDVGTELFTMDRNHVIRLAADLYPGFRGSSPRELFAFDQTLFFVAETPGHGYEPCRSDGTSAGTFLLADLEPGQWSSEPREFTALGTQVLFIAQNRQVGRELFVTDGQASGTRLFAELQPGPSSSLPTGFVPAFGGLAFRLQYGIGLYLVDGNANGARLLSRVRVNDLGRFGTRLLMSATDQWDFELWSCEGTSSSTRLVSNLHRPQPSSNPRFLTAWEDQVFFTARTEATGIEPWISDGRAGGTRRVSDLYPGVESSDVDEAVPWNGAIYFPANDGVHGRELFRTNGTVGGTQLVLDAEPGPSGSAIEQLSSTTSDLYFRATTTATGQELWHATYHQPPRVIDLVPGTASSEPDELTPIGDRIYFVADDGTSGRELWVSRGTSNDTRLVKDIVPGTTTGPHPVFLSPFASSLLFWHDFVPWISDGTSAGTQPWNVAFHRDSIRDVFHATGNRAFFHAIRSGSGSELWVTNGSQAGTIPLGTPIGYFLRVENLVPVDDRLFFTRIDHTHGRELWCSDGTLAGTSLVLDLAPGARHGVHPGTLRRLGGSGEILFAGTDGRDGLQLWTSDGTAVGTRPLGRIGSHPGSGAASIGDIRIVGRHLFVGIDDGIHGMEPWHLDLTSRLEGYAASRGTGCPGTNGLVPRASTIGTPTIGNAAFSIDVVHARPRSTAIAWISESRASRPLPGECDLLVGSPAHAYPATLTDAFGYASTPAPIPNTPTLTGRSVSIQYVVLDRQGAFSGSVSFSNAVDVTLGG